MGNDQLQGFVEFFSFLFTSIQISCYRVPLRVSVIVREFFSEIMHVLPLSLSWLKLSLDNVPELLNNCD